MRLPAPNVNALFHTLSSTYLKHSSISEFAHDRNCLRLEYDDDRSVKWL